MLETAEVEDVVDRGYCAVQLEALYDYAENYDRLELQTGCGHMWDKYNDD